MKTIRRTLSTLMLAAAIAACGGRGPSAPPVATVDELLEMSYGSIPPLPRSAGLTGTAFARAKDLLRAGTAKVAESTIEAPDHAELEEVGAATVRQAAADLPRATDAAQIARVNRIVERLVEVLPASSVNRYRFDLYESDQVNAFMASGGRGIVLTGLLAVMPDDDELAFVLAHELSHGELDHAENQYRLAKAGVKLTERIRDGSDGRFEVWATKLLTSVYDQDMEFEADRLGFALATRAGYPADAAARALGVLGRLGADGATPGGGAARIAYDIRATHPPIRERIAYAGELARRREAAAKALSEGQR